MSWTRWLSLLARLGLAVVWLASGWLKAVDPLQTVVAVRAYQLLPEAAVTPFAAALPFIEIGLGLLLMFGVGVRQTATCSAVLQVVFLFGVASAWARGLSIDCGCFGSGGAADVGAGDYLAELARDLGFLMLAVWLIVRPHSPLALGAGSRTEVGVAFWTGSRDRPGRGSDPEDSA
ncbi:MAG: MauE/DoxX family redox-associated membrane protein [Mycobacteriaceae bacterium]